MYAIERYSDKEWQTISEGACLRDDAIADAASKASNDNPCRVVKIETGAVLWNSATDVTEDAA